MKENSQQTTVYYKASSSLKTALTQVEKQQSADLHQTFSSLHSPEMLHRDFAANQQTCILSRKTWHSIFPYNKYHKFWDYFTAGLSSKSQCSTLVRNTVVRATFKVNGKPPILGSRSPLTPWPIDLKLHTGDYVGDRKPQAKNGKNRPRRAGPEKGWNVKVNLGYFFIFIEFLACRWRSQFCTDQHRFCARWRVSVGTDFLGGLIVRVKIFPLLNPKKPQIFGPFLDLEIFARNA